MKAFILSFFILSTVCTADPQAQAVAQPTGAGNRQAPGAFNQFGGFGGQGFGGGGFGGGGFGGGGFGGGGFGGGGGMGQGSQAGKEAAKNIEQFGKTISEGITKAQQEASKNIADSAKNNLDFNKLTPDLNSQVADGLKQVNEGVEKINEQFKSDGERKSIGEDTVNENIEAIKANTAKQFEINAEIAKRFTSRPQPSVQSGSAAGSNLGRLQGGGNAGRSSNPIASAMGAQPPSAEDPNHSEGRGFTRGKAYNSPFGGSH